MGGNCLAKYPRLVQNGHQWQVGPHTSTDWRDHMAHKARQVIVKISHESGWLVNVPSENQFWAGPSLSESICIGWSVRPSQTSSDFVHFSDDIWVGPHHIWENFHIFGFYLCQTEIFWDVPTDSEQFRTIMLLYSCVIIWKTIVSIKKNLSEPV